MNSCHLLDGELRNLGAVLLAGVMPPPEQAAKKAGYALFSTSRGELSHVSGSLVDSCRHRDHHGWGHQRHNLAQSDPKRLIVPFPRAQPVARTRGGDTGQRVNKEQLFWSQEAHNVPGQLSDQGGMDHICHRRLPH
jgi:hypothetical protein